MIGEWICEEEDGQMLIRMDPDGRIIHVLGPNDAVDIGYFWFSDGAFHVISDVDGAANESVFHVGMETDETGTFLRFAQCGGNCAKRRRYRVAEWSHTVIAVCWSDSEWDADCTDLGG